LSAPLPIVIAVGIDIAKRTHQACFMGKDGQQIGKGHRFRNTHLSVSEESFPAPDDTVGRARHF
jgi:hypothetical protein